MKFLANENFPLDSVSKLANAGLEVESVTLMMQGEPDERISFENSLSLPSII